MRSFLFLVLLAWVSLASAQEAHIAVTFTGDTSHGEATYALYELDLHTALPPGSAFEPVVVSVPSDELPGPAALAALFAAGAVSVGVTRPAAQLVALREGGPFAQTVEEVEQQITEAGSPLSAYSLRVEFGSGWTGSRAVAAVEQALGVEAPDVNKRANTLHLTLPTTEVPAALERLQSLPIIVAANVE